MSIISCIKQVHDLDIVLKDDWVVNSDGISIDIEYANRMMNTFDETSLELMLRLSDEHRMTTKVITLGDPKSETILRKAMAVGVDEAVRINSSKDMEFRPQGVALYLKTYIQKELNNNQVIEIILCGRQADNGNHGQTGQLLAEMLGWPCITMVTDIKKLDNEYRISRMVDQGIAHVYVNTPVVVTVTQTNNKLLRMTTLKAMIDAKKKAIEVFTVDFSDKKEFPVSKLERLTINTPKNSCHFIEDEANNTKCNQLINILKNQLVNEE